ncbi:MAG: hypothetical protein EAX96_19285 [Candidatus Lokiarchaeota archaeon]|nr:hypothetical protein [Candidatus Lokiarchaeota archaeon]
MALKKYVLVLMGFIISLIIFSIIIILGVYAKEIKLALGQQIIPPEYVTYFIWLLPGTVFTDVPILYALNIAFFFLFFALATPVTLFWIKIHKITSFKRKKYGIVELGTTVKFHRLFYRAFIISLFAFSMSALIIQAGFGSYFRASEVISTEAKVIFLHEAEALFLASFFVTPFVMLLFFPIWILEDCGVMAVKVLPEERIAPDIEGVHSIFLNILQGYAGFSTIINLVIYIVQGIIYAPPPEAAFLTPMILILLPFILTGLFTGPIILYEKYLPKIRAKLHPKLVEQYNFEMIKMPVFEDLIEKK